MRNQIGLIAMSVTSYALAKAIVMSLSQQLVNRGVLTNLEATEMVDGIVRDVRNATSDFQVPEFWFDDLTQFARDLGKA